MKLILFIIIQILNVFAFIAKPFRIEYKQSPPIGNIKSFYPNIRNSNDNDHNDPKIISTDNSNHENNVADHGNEQNHENQTINNPIPANTPAPVYTPTPTPITKPTRTPKPVPTPKLNIEERIQHAAAQFLAAKEDLSNNKINILASIKKIKGKLTPQRKAILSKISLLDYPLEYKATCSQIKGLCYCNKTGFDIQFAEKQIVKRIDFAPFLRSQCSPINFTVEVTAAKEKYFFNAKLEPDVEDIQQVVLPFVIECNKISIHNVQTDPRSSDACFSSFVVQGPVYYQAI